MTHGHEGGGSVIELFSPLGVASMTVIVSVMLFMAGVLPIPVGYDRGRVKWLMWCGTGMHPMICYWTHDYGFQTLHPADRSAKGDST